MRIISFTRLVFPLLILASLLACSTSAPTTQPPEPTPTPTQTIPTPTESAPIGSGLCANPLFPVVQNATWTYSGDAGSEGTYTLLNTISAVQADGFSLDTSLGASTKHTQQWVCRPEGLTVLDIPGAAALALEQLDANFEVSNVQGVIVPVVVIPGDRWSFSLDIEGPVTASGITAQTSGQAVYEFTASGLESVTVPAGTFEAMRINGVLTLNATASISGIPLPLKVTINTTSWYAPGVGMVRTVTDGELPGIQINDAVELQTYQIP